MKFWITLAYNFAWDEFIRFQKINFFNRMLVTKEKERKRVRVRERDREIGKKYCIRRSESHTRFIKINVHSITRRNVKEKGNSYEIAYE